MLSRALPARAAAGAMALFLVAVPAADAKKKKPRRMVEARYQVIVRATMDEKWSFLERSEIECSPGSPCTTETKGSGTARIQLKAKPTTWLVMRGVKGRPPQINVGTGEGAQATGPYLRTGELSTIHGGEWAAANPPQVRPTTGCGTRSLTADFNVFFTKRNTLAPSAIVDTSREDCPTGPSSGLDWDDDAPSLGDVTASVSQTRFLSTKSFTVRGSKSWHASVKPPTGAYKVRSGEKTVTWSWEVTFNLLKKGRRYA
jgi:hypothetical protein